MIGRTSFFIIFNEIRKGLLVTWHYKFNLINEFITLGVNFLGTALLMNYGNTDLVEFGPSLLGFIMWVYAYCILNVSITVTLEGRSGTLEQMYMSPVHPAIIFIGSNIATLFSTTIMVFIMTFFITILCSIHLPFTLASLPIIFITLIGLIGFGLGIAGMALLYKNVVSLVDLIETILYYLNGSMLPIDRLPFWIQKIAYTLPTTEGIIVLRALVFGSVSYTELLYNGKLFSLFLNSGIYFVGGLLVFMYCERVAKNKGRLGQY